MQTVAQFALESIAAPSDLLQFLMLLAFLLPVVALLYRAYTRDTRLADILTPVPAVSVTAITAILSYVLSTLPMSTVMLPVTFAFLISLGVTVGVALLLGAKYAGLEF